MVLQGVPRGCSTSEDPQGRKAAQTPHECRSADSDLSEQELRRCRRSFRKHCIERHGLHPKDTGRLYWFDLEVLTLTLLDHPS
jgi:hypothetical protein